MTLSATEAAELDGAIAEFENFLAKNGGNPTGSYPPRVDLPGIKDIFAKRPGGEGGPAAGAKVDQAVKRLYDSYLVARAARGLLTNPGDGSRYAHLVRTLFAEYRRAWELALNTNSAGYYQFSAALRQAAGTLADAYKRVQSNAQALNAIGGALSGAAALITALA